MEDFSLNYDILFPVLNTFTFDTEDHGLGVNYKVNNARPLKNLYNHCSFVNLNTYVYSYKISQQKQPFL